MAQITGVVCDWCRKMFSTNDKKADVHIKLSVVTNQDQVGGVFDLCSDECLHKLAIERRKASNPNYAKQMEKVSKGNLGKHRVDHGAA